MMTAQRCPVCRAGLRGTSDCSRCGAGLTEIQLLLARAYVARRRARLALQAGDYGRALELAGASQQLHATPQGRALERVARWSVLGDPAE